MTPMPLSSYTRPAPTPGQIARILAQTGIFLRRRTIAARELFVSNTVTGFAVAVIFILTAFIAGADMFLIGWSAVAETCVDPFYPYMLMAVSGLIYASNAAILTVVWQIREAYRSAYHYGDKIAADIRFEFFTACAKAQEYWADMAHVSGQLAYAVQHGLDSDILAREADPLLADYEELQMWAQEAGVMLQTANLGCPRMARVTEYDVFRAKTKHVEDLSRRIRRRAGAYRRALSGF